MEENKYKDTEVGRIPVDWEVKRLGEIFEFLQSGTNPRSDLTEEGNVKYIHYGDIHTKWDSILDCSTAQIPYIEESKVKNLPRLKEGDLIMADASEDYDGVGKSVEVVNVGEQQIVAGLHTILLRGNKEAVADGFKGYIQFIKSVKDSLCSIATGTSVYGISKKDLSNILIPLPPLPEQKAIAQVLSDMDELIESMEKLIHKKKQIKQGTMQELLTGKKRLPGFSGEWTVKKLGDIATITMGQSPSSTYYNTRFEGLPLIQGNADLVNRKTAKRIYTKQITKKCKKGDIILTVRAPVGKVGKATFDACIGRGVCAISYTNDYLYYYLMHIEEYWDKLSKGTTFDSVNSSDIQALLIPLPPLPEQKAIAQILSDMDAEIEALEKKLDKYIKIKEGMMEKLLTGQVRLV